MTSQKREFAEHLEALRARLGREHRPPSREEWRGLRDRHVAWVRWAQELADTPPGPGHLRVIAQPTPWELIEVEFGPEPMSAHEGDIDQVQRRDALPVAEVVEIVRLRHVEEESWRDIIERRLLSSRKVDYVREALLHDDLGWDASSGVLTLGEDTENSRDGIRLPKR